MIYYCDLELYDWTSNGVINIEMLREEAPIFYNQHFGIN